MITIYNTLGRTTETFEPLRGSSVGMYVCGPTVQSSPHLGHGRFAVAFDAIRRYLIWRGYDVTYVQNVTDVDDKIINNAAEQGIEPNELAVAMTERFRSASDALNVTRPDVEPKATEHMQQMFEIIERLIEKDVAYVAGGDVYFRVRGYDGYGKLSGRNVDDLMVGARIEPGEVKDDPLDFALWKGAKPGEPSWESPWGPGRPGWHIECSAMSATYLGTSFDIHAGGNDLIFPHHENEIAQSEAANDALFAKYWLHNGMVNLGGEKMSKSTGHIIDLDEAIETYGGDATRLFYLRAHYRSPLEFSTALLDDAAAAMDRLMAFARRVADIETVDPDAGTMDEFTTAMDDDFGTPEALAVVFETVRRANAALDAGDDAAALASAFAEMTSVLGFDLEVRGLDDLDAAVAAVAESLGVTPGDDADATLVALMAERARARDEKEWALADGIRDGLAGVGIIIEDSADGARWYRK